MSMAVELRIYMRFGYVNSKEIVDGFSKLNT